MPLAPTMSAIQAQVNSAQKTDIAGVPDLTSTLITAAIASVVPAGLFPAGAIMIPLVPAGFSACQALMKSSFNMGIGGAPSAWSQAMASAIATLVPMVPPTGMAVLQTLLQSIANMNIGGTSDVTSQMIASAIIAFYTAGMVI